MPFERPTLGTLIELAEGDFVGELGPTLDPRLRRSPERGLVKAAAGLAHGIHGRIDYVAKQLNDPTAEKYLVRKAATYGVFRIAAVKAIVNATFPGVNGTVLPALTVIQRNDGVAYITNADATVAGGTVTTACTAAVAGAVGNVTNPTPVSLVNPVLGITSSGNAAPGSRSGADIESLGNFHDRYLTRRRTPPKGGGPGDWANWAREVAGVTRAWEYGKFFGPNTVGIAFVLDEDLVSIIPDGPKLAEVQAHVQSKATITVDAFSMLLTAAPLDLTIHLSPDTTAIRNAVIAEIDDYVRRSASPGGTAFLSQINEAISVAAGEDSHELISPVSNQTRTQLQFTTRGTITWA